MENKEISSLAVIESSVSEINEKVAVVNIKNDLDYKDSAEFLFEIKKRKSMIDEFFNDDIKKANELHKSLTSKKKSLLDPLKMAENFVKQARIAYEDQRNVMKAKEQEKVNEESKQKEEKLLQEFEDKAKEAEEKGDIEKAKEYRLMKQQVFVPTATVDLPLQNGNGISKRKSWRAEVTNFMDLVKAVANGEASPLFLQADQQALNAFARTTQGTHSVNGVRFYENVTEVVK
jgi:hypothetical protein